MKYLNDDFQSISMLLAEAHRQLRAGYVVEIEVKGEPLPSQAGALLHLVQLGQVTLGTEIAQKLERYSEGFQRGFDFAEIGKDLGLLASWLDQTDDTKAQATKIGFWLSSFFLSEKSGRTAIELTKVLTGERIKAPPKHGKRIVRRYPTGGISEKQALILPALLHSISKDFEVASFFLIAGLLAHTGGTRAKLSILPGFEALHANQLQEVELRSMPVNYVSASETVCPRDAVLYRARSETGTVEDHDLMVSSIMSKQIAVPSDIIVIDVLHGKHSFLKSLDEAQLFGASCQSVATEFEINVECMYRCDDLFLPRSIGATTEILEAYEILRSPQFGDVGSNLCSELSVALSFIKALFLGAGLDAQAGEQKVRENLSSGEAVKSFIQVLQEHCVDLEWLSEFENQPSQKLLNDLDHHTIVAQKAGKLRVNYPALADAVNSQLNTPEYKGKYGFEVSPGGLILNLQHNDSVAVGSKVMEIYSKAPIVEKTLAVIHATYSIE